MVSEAFTDSDGTWIYLKAGWRANGCPGEHVIVEDTAALAISKLRYIEPCSCNECSP
jgi:hypothetical protein